MNWKISGLLLLFCFQVVLGQKSVAELKTTLNSSSSDSLRLEAALSLSKHYARVHLDSALNYAIQAEQIVTSLKSQTQLPRVRLQKAGILLSTQDFEKAELLLKENLKEPQLTSEILAKTYQNLGNLNIYQKNYDKATSLYLNALEIYEQENDSLGIAKVTSNIGIVYSRLKNFNEAILFFEKAKKHAEEDQVLKLQVLGNLTGIYGDTKDFEKSIITGKEALSLAEKINSPIYMGFVYSNLCNSYLGAKNYDYAIESALKGIEIKEKLKQNTDILFNNLGYAHLQKEEYSKAITYLKEVSPKAGPTLKSLVYNNLSDAYGNLNDHRSAWQFGQMHKKISDSLNGIMLLERDSISSVIRRYETEKNAQALDLLNTKNELSQSKIKTQRHMLWAIGLSSFFLLLLGIVIYKNQKSGQQLKAALIKHRLLRTQLNPHFLFNALNSMQGFNYADEKKKLSNYINSFSKLMRSILESSDQDLITVENDANAIREYLTLQRLSSNEKFDAIVSIAEDIDSQILIPPMFTQPFVENAVIHGMKNRKDGSINVSYQKKGNNLVFLVKDNGIGFSNESSNDSSKLHRSMSTDILKERIINLQKTKGYACKMQTTSDTSGTTVTLTFPYYHKKIGVSLNHE
ncbi:tetratricopeptide repeat protein [Maribacter algarum]|uniref:Tetratricopeptide repeat protein n=1 Tax=Maribacter algarum (ex Zhang et al. 2020) TaxID=2578118 RepID=A0A5S3PVP3_9FLAO|nr:tetratricopeptide repeat protein [Maribacter algarum]TMM59045.1 tetratricopeptide repeat protein [Maribacter algarum]